MLIPYKLKENSLKIVKIIQLKEGFKLDSPLKMYSQSSFKIATKYE